MLNTESGKRHGQRRWRAALLAALCAGLLAGAGEAADDPVQKAMKGLERRRYEDAAKELRAALPGLPAGKQAQARLALGMIYARSAELHRALADLSAAVNADYLNRLSRQRGAGRSRYGELYLGLAELVAGRADRAEAALGKFAAGPADAASRDIARVALGRAALVRGDRQQAVRLWSEVASADPEVKAALADGYSSAGMAERDPAAMCDSALAGAQQHGRQVSVDAAVSCAAVYARTGSTEKGAALLQRVDLKEHSYRESLGRSKVLSFYDVRLLANLADHLYASAVAELESAASDAALRATASYYLGEAHALEGKAVEAGRAFAVFLGAPQAPAQYRNRAIVLQAELQHRAGKRSEAIAAWEDLTRSHPSDPALFADILAACGRLRIECPRPAQTGAAAAAAGEGKRFAALHIGLGRYYQGRKDDSRAVAAFEAGRDKGNKNKIEFNDPLMLTELAGAYYRTKKYSEALEIFFEMSKQYPQVRQVQEALQGIYSMEHKSAGDVKIN